MMQAESAEFQVQKTMAKLAAQSFHSDTSEGPDDEFRPVKISIVTTTRETRDEGEAIEINTEEEIRMCGDDERETGEENDREEAEGFEVSQEIELQSVISALGKSQDQELEGEKIEQPPVALFDTSLMEDAKEDVAIPANDDNLSVVSKSVVDESSKNVEEAEALAEKMKRELAESLAAFSNSPQPSEDDDVVAEPTQAPREIELPTSNSSDSVHSSKSGGPSFYSKNKVLKLASPLDGIEGGHRIELASVGSALESASVASSSSRSDASVSLRRSRSRFRHRRPSTSSWANANAEASPKAAHNFPALSNLTLQQQHLLENIVIPAVFLIVAVAICRTFFHPWLKVGNAHSNTWALTWTILCIIAVVAPVCALEYMLLGGLLAGTVVQEALAKYPEVKKFLKEVRRMRLKAGWWYPSEVRTLRKDLEATNAKMIQSQRFNSEEDADARSIQRTMSREEHRLERVQLEKVFDSDRAEWFAVKEQLMAEAATEKGISAKLQDQLETEQQKLKQTVAQKEQLENNIEVERAQWTFSRKSLEEALKTAVAAQEDNEKTKEFFAKMEHARDEERIQWEKERQGFQATIQQSEEDARLIQQEHEAKMKLFDEMGAAKQAQWETERASLKEAVKNAIEEAKSVKDTLESQICQLMDANDVENEKDMRNLTAKFEEEKLSLQKMLEETNREQHVSTQCVSNLQSVLEEERAEWKSAREALEEELKVAKADQERTEKLLEAADNRKYADQGSCVTTALRQELTTKDSKIKALEISIQQLQNIISIQEKTISDDEKAEADREASGKLVPVAYVRFDSGSVDSSESAEEEASTYYSWVERIQETHGKEQRQMLKGLFHQHVRWQEANQHVRQLLESSRSLLEASETFESSESFQECLVNHAATSLSAKKYMDELASKKSLELPEAIVEAPVQATTDTSNRAAVASTVSSTWMKSTLLWEKVKDNSTNPKAVATTVCSGIAVGLGLFHARGMKR